MHTQNDEEEHILKHLEGRTGRLLDIGANDGEYASNSLALIERGWSGVLVEPHPVSFTRLAMRHLYNPKVTLVNAAIGGLESRLTKFWTSASDGGQLNPYEALSTTEEKQRIARANGSGFRPPFWIPLIPLGMLLETLPGPIDFLSIDTEGTSVDLFVEFLLRGKEKPRVICVEHDGFIERCTSVAKHYDYREVAQNPTNLIFVHGA